ncbi:sulfotransferase domain-containing protein [Nonomuraea turkmeniaca]|uniref:Sulfotransferase domain-containing protein n=1 Tax=Nonomuraea turkmeniaca TaxID=103838 RepID=A0A5S4FLQ5_9ACTN|nr:sulfotransferase domain-containing protein [Nonomuraea turkmeniaca]TMR21612.1 sulfotransferase domain-containing protein [Nonomuraea turkmeniaca]
MRTTKRSALSLSRGAGRLTSGARVLPSFLIVGAQRCGTTSLYRALAHHPLLLKPVLHKGVHYFDVGYRRGISWYQGHFPLRVGAALLERRYDGRALAFESSPYYLFHPLAGERIAADLPDVKLIVLVRDPVERACSAHAHELARGFEKESHFEYAVELEAGRLAEAEELLRASPHTLHHSHRHHAYVARGRYADQLDRLEPLFGRDRILVLDSHRFFRDPGPVYDRVLEFLGVPHLGYPVFEQHNGRALPRPVPRALGGALRERFEPYDARLVRWLGEEPSWRR